MLISLKFINIRLVFLLAIIILQSGCGASLKSLIVREAELRQRQDFNAYLAREYLQYSRDLANRYNWRDADHFASKGVMAANNREIYPEVPENWGLNADSLDEVSLARQRLELLLNPKTKYYLPIQLAHLFMLYDCWLSNEEKHWNLSGLSRCKTRFLLLVTEIEDKMNNLKLKKEVKVVDIEEPKFKKFDVYFDFDSYVFNSRANIEFFELLDYLETLNGDFRILLAGNADRKGHKIYNANLARKRVLVTRDMLTKNGVPMDAIEVKSYGENSPEIITKDGKRNKYNRLVGVYVLKGSDSISAIPLPLIDNYIYKNNIRDMKITRGLRIDN